MRNMRHRYSCQITILACLGFGCFGPALMSMAQSPSTGRERPLSAELEAGIATRHKQVLDWSRHITGLGHPKYGGYDCLAFAARDGNAKPEWADYMVELGSMGLKGHRDFEMFALPPLVRYLYTYGDRLTSRQRSALLAGLTGTRRNLFAHGTPNHMIMQESSWYLLASISPRPFGPIRTVESTPPRRQWPG